MNQEKAGKNTAFLSIREDIDWEKFLSRHDLYWTVRPLSWDEGAFLGNGLMGAMIYGEEHRLKRHCLRFVMGRTDITAKRKKGFSPRIPLGEFDLEMEGNIYYGTTMRLDLWNAELRADLITVSGRARLRAFIHHDDMVMVVELKPDSGEKNAELRWYPWSKVDPILKNADTFNFNQYIPDSVVRDEERNGVHISIQTYLPWPEGSRLKPGNEDVPSDGNFDPALQKIESIQAGGCTTAWIKKVEKDGTKRWYASIANGCDERAVKEAAEAVTKAASANPEQYIREHREAWHRYYRQSFVSFTDTGLEGFYWIQMYKLACATRPEAPILDNQGPWLTTTPWPGTWFNMNVQMSYSPVYTSNRLELGESLCRTLDACRDNLILNAPKEYQEDSAALGRSCSHDLKSPVGKETGNLTWVLHNYWRQYRYSMDDDMLKDRLYPLLRRSINLYLHMLYKGEDGKLHLPSTISPEFGSFKGLTVEDCGYDLALLRWGCRTLLYIVNRLGIQDELEDKWRYVLDNLTDYPVDETGLMIGKDTPLDHGHRHFSHMLAVFPLHILNCDTDENRSLIHRSLRHWLSMEGDLRGFTFTGAASIAAAMGRGNEALAYVKTALHLFKPNTFYREAGPVIESPLACAESIQDMLIQSWGDTIRIFPAVPDEWPDITIHNLRAEGAFLVSAMRRGGKTLWIRIKSLMGEPCRVQTDIPGEIGIVTTGSDKEMHSSRAVMELTLKAGEEALLYPLGMKENLLDNLLIKPVKERRHLCNYFGQNKPWRLYGIPISPEDI